MTHKTLLSYGGGGVPPLTPLSYWTPDALSLCLYALISSSLPSLLSFTPHPSLPPSSLCSLSPCMYFLAFCCTSLSSLRSTIHLDPLPTTYSLLSATSTLFPPPVTEITVLASPHWRGVLSIHAKRAADRALGCVATIIWVLCEPNTYFYLFERKPLSAWWAGKASVHFSLSGWIACIKPGNASPCWNGL